MRESPLDLDPEKFRRIGHHLVDTIVEFLAGIRERPVTRGESPEEIRAEISRLLSGEPGLPAKGEEAARIVDETAKLVIDHSLLNGHPSFYGYITSSAAPIGALADFLAAAVNPNVGSFQLAPVATEIEAQSVGWIAELIGYPADCGGVLVSGGNMANMVCFLAGRRARLGESVRSGGLASLPHKGVAIYTSAETHTWISKAADLFGFGTDAIRWIPVDERQRMQFDALAAAIAADRARGIFPLMVIATGGSVGTGAIDPIREIAVLCKREGIWLHVDGAYGAVAAALPDVDPDLKALSLADSVAVDPHKWLYAPLEAGCALVRDPRHLKDAFSFAISYFTFHDPRGTVTNYYELGMQNSRGFRALKIWMALRQVGRNGYLRMVGEDIRLARELYDEVGKFPELERFTHGLSIATFRYVPPDEKMSEEALNELNAGLLSRLQQEGKLFLSNVVIGKKFVLRACIVNFRTLSEDVRKVPELVIECGGRVARELRAK